MRYAPTFDASLASLGYAAPELLGDALAAHGAAVTAGAAPPFFRAALSMEPEGAEQCMLKVVIEKHISFAPFHTEKTVILP